MGCTVWIEKCVLILKQLFQFFTLLLHIEIMIYLILHSCNILYLLMSRDGLECHITQFLLHTKKN